MEAKDEVCSRLEQVEIIANHMAQQKKLVIEDDTCLIRILDGLKTILKRGVAKSDKIQKILNKLLHHCKLGLQVKTESHKCFLISLFGILVSNDGICNLKNNKKFIEYLKDFVQHIQLDPNVTNTVLNSWLIAFQNMTPATYFIAFENGFDVNVVCKATQSSSIFVARSAVKLLSIILIGFYSSQKKTAIDLTDTDRKKNKEKYRTVKLIVELKDFDAYLKVFTEIAKVNVVAAKNMENNCRNELDKNKKYTEFYNKLYDHKIKSAQNGTTVIANYIHAFNGHKNSKKHNMDVNLQNIAVEFVFCNPLREHSYKLLVLMGRSENCSDFAQQCLRRTLMYFLKISETKPKRYDVARWNKVVDGCHGNKRDLVAKIVTCTLDAIRELHLVTMQEKHQIYRPCLLALFSHACDRIFNLHLVTMQEKHQIYRPCLLALFSHACDRNNIHPVKHECVVDNSKIQMAFLRNIHLMFEIETNSPLKAIAKNSLLHEGEFFFVINSIPTSDIKSSQMFRYIFHLTLLSFNIKVCGINSESVLVSTKRLEELITHGLLHCTSDWQYKDEVYEGVKLFFDDVVEGAIPTRYHYQVIDALNKTNFIDLLTKHLREDESPYVRASCVDCLNNLYYIYDKHMLVGEQRKAHNVKQVLMILLKCAARQLTAEKMETVQLKLVKFATYFLQKSPDLRIKSSRFFSDLVKQLNDNKKNQKNLNVMIDFQNFLDDLNQSKDQGFFATAVCEGVFRLARLDVDAEVRVECLKLIGECMENEKSEFETFLKNLNDPALKNFSLGDSPFSEEKAAFQDLDSLLDDVTFRITSSDRHTRLHTHHGNHGDECGDDVKSFVDESGREVHDVILDCY